MTAIAELREEAAQILKSAVRGEVLVELEDARLTWAGVFAGDCAFLIGGWRFVFFNDCLDLDYVDSVQAPDGRSAGCDDWWADGTWCDPLNFLTTEEHAKFERLLERCGKDDAPSGQPLREWL